MYIMSVSKCKEIDNQTINDIGIPGIVLMENAASEVTRRIKKFGHKVLVVCGKGNNGGDGLAIARKLYQLGKLVEVIILSQDDNYSEDFTTNITILKNIGCEIFHIRTIEELDILRGKIKGKNLVVDAIFGVGLKRALNEFYFKAIEIINNEGIKIISIDVPSGLDGDTGRGLGNSIKANITYTFEVIKKGFLEYRALEYIGDLEVVNIGIPNKIKEENCEGVFKLSEDQYKEMIPRRDIYGHKGTYGKATLIAGSKGMSGAAFICTESCVKSGAGITRLITTSYVQQVLSSKLTEAIVFDSSDIKVDELINDSSVIGIGPGLGKGEEAINLLKKVLKAKIPVVVDADALNIISEDEGALKYLSGRAVITPHPGEMSRLIKKEIGYIEKNRIEVAKKFARNNDVIVVLKGFNSIITDGKEVIVNSSGNSKMASGGMGDALTGIITSYIAQGLDMFTAAKLGVYIHGYIGDVLGKTNYSVVATDIIENIQKVVNKLAEK